MHKRSRSPQSAVLTIAIVLAVFDLLLEVTGLIVRYGPGQSGLDLEWEIQPGVLIPILIVIAIYGYGLSRSSDLSADNGKGRIVAFFTGIFLLLVALQSPFDGIADRLFVAHQVQHLTLAMSVPLLIVLARPTATLRRGVPIAIKRNVLTPLFAHPRYRALRVFAHPVFVTVMYIGLNYFWMIPRFHDAALQSELVHAVLHASLFIAGLAFYSRMLDRRPYPLSASLGMRLFLLWLAAMSEILLGAFLAFKSVPLYSAYGSGPHLFGISPLDDEAYGGLTMWIPGGGMLALSAIFVIDHLGFDEERRLASRASTNNFESGRSVARRQTDNRKMAFGLASFAVLVMTMTVAAAALYHHAGNRLFDTAAIATVVR